MPSILIFCQHSLCRFPRFSVCSQTGRGHMLSLLHCFQTLADEMDQIYMYGGFKFAFEGTVDEDGIYASPYEEDEDLYPLARFYHPDNNLEVFVYKYGIIAIRDSKNIKSFKIARFD